MRGQSVAQRRANVKARGTRCANTHPGDERALVLTGSGASGAYHAGVLKAIDESGVKLDLVVGSGVGTLGAAFAAVAGGARLYGPEGFWRGLDWGSLYRLRSPFSSPPR